MLTELEIEVMCGDGFRRSVEANLDRDPMAVALDKRVSNAALVASQVKYLGRARAKLPSYYAARCILPPLAFEQASSEQAAAHKEYSGVLCIDLTCGLGVDSYYLSQRFDRVIAVERNPVLAAVARVNFELLGAANIEVVNCEAAQFLADNSDLRPDLIYADPDRRGSRGEKLVRLEDCSPNMIEICSLPGLEAVRVVIKCSPMFDVDEAFRAFGDHIGVEVVSLGGENKEVVIDLSDAITAPRIKATALGHGSVCYLKNRERLPVEAVAFADIAAAGYLILPDPALQKARVAVDYYRGLGFMMTDNNGYAYATADTLPAGVIGRVARIERVEPFNAKRLKRYLKAESIERIDILKRNFAMETSMLERQLGIKQGGRRSVAFTTESGERIALFVSFSTFV